MEHNVLEQQRKYKAEKGQSDQQRVVMRYRCGWCGRPTLEDGTPMPLIEVGLIDDIDGEYKDAEEVNGGCCG